MNASDTLLLLIDMQEKLWPAIEHRDRVLARATLLLRASSILNVKVLATEQYPAGLGGMIAELRPLVQTIFEKTAFSAVLEPGAMEAIEASGAKKVLLAGIEAHVCVLQTALDLSAAGFSVYVAADAIGSRQSMDCQMALHRMNGIGVTVTTAEAAVFEWTRDSKSSEFRAISQLVKATPPDGNAL
jgi:nicotinamidase-related amidase